MEQLTAVKMRLIGFYNKPDQNMKPEERNPEAAELLASSLKKSFKSLLDNPSVDDVFRSVLKGKSVFVLKDENGKLYAYYPLKNLARVNDVVYYKPDVTAVPLIYKGWFYPGEAIPLITKKQAAVNGSNEKKSLYKVSSCGQDFLITWNGKTLPLDWGEDIHITYSELRNLLSHKWVVVTEFDTSDRCGDCDGYDYSRCDMDRCKDDCENCGGRRYICHNGCFYHRHDKACEIHLKYDEIYAVTEPIIDVLKKAITPHCKNYHELFESIKPRIASLAKDLSPLLAFFSIGNYQALLAFMKSYEDLAVARDKARVETPLEIYGIKVSPSDVKVNRHGFMFWHKWHIESAEKAYDYVEDRFVYFDFKLYTPDEHVIEKLIKCVENKDSQSLKKILQRIKVKDRHIVHKNEN